MADNSTGEAIAAALGTCLAFLATLGAVLKFWNKDPEPKGPEKEETSMGALLQRIAVLEQRADSAETARIELREDLRNVFEKLDDLAESAARIEGALGVKRSTR